MHKNRTQQQINCASCHAKDLCLAKNQEANVVRELNDIIPTVKLVSKGEHFIYMNDDVQYMFAVYSGCCKEYQVDENGNEHIKNFFFPGDIIGLESIPDRKHLFSAVALEDTQLCMISLDALLRLMCKHNDLLKRFIDIGSYKMQNDNQIRPTTNANQRIADFILNIYIRLQERDMYKGEIELPMSQVDISNFLGMAHETVNRTLRMMHKNAIIQFKNKKISKINIIKLQEMASFNLSAEQAL